MADKNIESAYKLSPMQQGMLFHTLLDSKSGVYFIQLRSVIQGPLNVPAFKRAWQRVMERHSVLRTAFFWEEMDKPLQVVYRQVALPWEQLDWRDVSDNEQSARLDALLQADREHGFTLTKAPLMRCTVIRLADDSYSFVWSIHHILMDGWCLPIIFKELFAFYHAFSQGQDLRLRPLRPYRDYIRWLQEQDLSAAESFWRKLLQGFSAPTPLIRSTASVEAANAVKQYAEWTSNLPTATTAALQDLAHQNQLTLNTIVQGVWALLLSRYSNEQDIVFGAIVSGRPADLAGSETMIGLFINTLPVRVQVPPQALVVSWLKDLQAQQVEQRQYEYSPLVQVQGWSDVPRGTPLFESIVVFENYPIEEIGVEQASTIAVRNVSFIERTHYPITLIVAPRSALSLQLGYDTRTFDAATIERMLGQLQTLLEGVAADPDSRIADLPMLTAAERDLLDKCNATAIEYRDAAATLHELIEAQVAHTPDAIALVYGDRQLTYRELNERANQLAHHLHMLGVGVETPVGVYAERSLELVVALLGVLKAGGAYVPLDPAYPAERVAFILADVQSPILLTQQHLLSNLPQCSARSVCLDHDWPVIAQQPVDELGAVSGPDNLAYLIYTSGSTGRPKGVAITHASAVAFLHWAYTTFSPDDLAGTVATTSICFDLSIFELFAPLGCGGTVLLVDNALHISAIPDPERITLINTVPSVLLEVLRGAALPPRLRVVNLAGEPLPLHLAQTIHQQAPHARLFNLYGPSEDTTYSTVAQIMPGDERPPAIGRPIANSQAYVLDPQMQPVPIGVVGELYLGGTGLARGYLNRPALTAERFIPNPFGIDGTRLYKTGDLARYRADGEIEYLGRIDHQVKVRGFRIELGEIESVLWQHPVVRDVVVVVREDQSDPRLVAYIVEQRTTNQGHGTTGPQEQSADQAPASPTAAGEGEAGAAARSESLQSELRLFLGQRLPGYMIPSAFVFLPALPITPNGKIDRKALPAPDQLRPALEKPFVAPSSDDEVRLVQIWADALKLERVGVHDSFFDLGGHSLVALQILGKVRDAFQVKLTLRQFFDAPTIAQLARLIAVLREPGADTAQEAAPTALAAEVVLDAAIHPDGLAAPGHAAPATIFLTGATGFLGAFLLHELLTQTHAEIHCLVRAANLEQGHRKLQAQLEQYLLWEPALAPRIIPVIGDLAQPLLGLGPEQFQLLAQAIDAIYHNGALVNFAYPYSVLKAPNVLGTQEILRLAVDSKLKPVHFISTTGIFYSDVYAQADTVYETDPLESTVGLHGGYSQSKWVAEKIVMLARARGIPVTIYRPGRIGWDSRTGIWNSNDLLYKMIKGCIEIGAAPDLDYPIEITPVDFVGKAVVHLSRQPSSIGRAFHLVNPATVPWNRLVAQMHELDCPLDALPHAEWLAKLKDALKLTSQNALQSWVSISAERALEGEGATHAMPLRFDISQTLNGLAGTSMRYPEVDETVVRPLVAYLLKERTVA